MEEARYKGGTQGWRQGDKREERGNKTGERGEDKDGGWSRGIIDEDRQESGNKRRG